MRKILSLLRRCVEDYDMISPGERVAVGVSGGKDSLVLLAGLAQLSTFYPGGFSVEAWTGEGAANWLILFGAIVVTGIVLALGKKRKAA